MSHGLSLLMAWVLAAAASGQDPTIDPALDSDRRAFLDQLATAAQTAIPLAEPIVDPEDRAGGLQALADVLRRTGDQETARRLIFSSLEAADHLEGGAATLLTSGAALLAHIGDQEAASPRRVMASLDWPLQPSLRCRYGVREP
jgi:hypothetical protein